MRHFTLYIYVKTKMSNFHYILQIHSMTRQTLRFEGNFSQQFCLFAYFQYYHVLLLNQNTHVIKLQHLIMRLPNQLYM